MSTKDALVPIAEGETRFFVEPVEDTFLTQKEFNLMAKTSVI